jgi:hypothetical protein
MNCSMWWLTAICLTYGAGNYDRAPWVAQPGPAPGIVQTQNPGQEYPIGGGGPGGTADAAHAAGCPCDEHPGLFARLFNRLRALFGHSNSGGYAEAGTGRCQACRTYACGTCGNDERHGPSLSERLASLFRHSSPAAAGYEPAPGMIAKMIPEPAPSAPGAYTPGSPIQYAAATPTPSVIQPVSTAPSYPAARPAMEIAKHYLDKVANADDYTWVTGQLFYIHVHADQGLWVVRYAPIDKEDRYGGSIVLAPAAPMGGLREGDLVTVRGEILDEGRASRHLGGPLYRATDVGLKDRSKP